MKRARLLTRLALFAGFAAAAAAAWLGYQQPEFAVWLGTASWLCS